MAEQDSNFITLPKWKPKPLGRHDRSKRKAGRVHAWSNPGRWPKATAEELDAVIRDMGPGLSLSDQKKTELLRVMNTNLFNLADGMTQVSLAPPISECKELLEGFLGNLRKTLRSLDLDQPIAEIRKMPGLTRMINPSLNQQLALATGLEGWVAFDEVVRLVRAMASLGTLAEHGLAQLQTAAPTKTARPEKMISVCLAQVYRNAFRLEPTRTVGGPWLKFLRWGLKIVGSPTGGLTDDALKKLPISPSR
jgi:hypothetical protein